MERHGGEDLRALYEQFLSSEEAERAVNDVQAGERMLQQYPAPELDPEVLEDIKATLAVVAGHPRTRLYTASYRVAAVAATIMILSAVTTKLWERQYVGRPSVITASVLSDAIWESNDITVGDPVLALYIDELDVIADQVQSLQSGTNGSRSRAEKAFEELQMEFVEISSGFWQG